MHCEKVAHVRNRNYSEQIGLLERNSHYCLNSETSTKFSSQNEKVILAHTYHFPSHTS
jgi:hypothetical protein